MLSDWWIFQVFQSELHIGIAWNCNYWLIKAHLIVSWQVLFSKCRTIFAIKILLLAFEIDRRNENSLIQSQSAGAIFFIIFAQIQYIRQPKLATRLFIYSLLLQPQGDKVYYLILYEWTMYFPCMPVSIFLRWARCLFIFFSSFVWNISFCMPYFSINVSVAQYLISSTKCVIEISCLVADCLYTTHISQ